VLVLLVVLLVAVILLVVLLGPRRAGTHAFLAPADERALIDRAAKGDADAAAELERRGTAEEAALKARAVADPRAARDYLERKASQLQALEWARDGLREAPGGSPAQTEQVRARIERQYDEVAKEVAWAKGKLGRPTAGG
jgi:hypothetical protein